MWFNDDDDADEVMPFSSEIIGKKVDNDLDTLGMTRLIFVFCSLLRKEYLC